MTIETVSKSLMLVVLILSFISLVYTLACIAFGGFVFYVSILLLHYINPFMPDRISHCYQSEQPISVLRVVGLYFTFLIPF